MGVLCPAFFYHHAGPNAGPAVVRRIRNLTANHSLATLPPRLQAIAVDRQESVRNDFGRIRQKSLPRVGCNFPVIPAVKRRVFRVGDETNEHHLKAPW